MISKERYYVTRDGRAVAEEELGTDTAGVYLLVGKGCEISDARARKYGIHPDQISQLRDKAVAAPPQDKAMRGPARVK